MKPVFCEFVKTALIVSPTLATEAICPAGFVHIASLLFRVEQHIFTGYWSAGFDGEYEGALTWAFVLLDNLATTW